MALSLLVLRICDAHFRVSGVLHGGQPFGFEILTIASLTPFHPWALLKLPVFPRFLLQPFLPILLLRHITAEKNMFAVSRR